MSHPQVKLVKPKTQKGKRALQRREPQQEEHLKRALFLFGERTSQVVKDVLSDLHKITQESVKYTKKNPNLRPFELGGETSLEHYARRTDCGLFVLGSHSKKRQHSLTIGRFYDGQLYDLCELCIEQYRSLQAFGGQGSSVQAGNKPCFLFVGQLFESSPQHKLAKNVLLDLLRGQQVDSVNLKGLDHIVLVAAAERKVHLRQYAVQLKKSGTKIPRVELSEMGPALDLSLHRFREATLDLAKEAHRQHKASKKKEKNVSQDVLEGKVGRLYLPKQNIDSIALHKMKGLKRERHDAAAAAKQGILKKRQRTEPA